MKKIFKMSSTDLIIIISIFVLAGISLGIIKLLQKPGDYVVVRCDGVEVAKYSLDIDGYYSLNDGTNTLKIKDGKASIVSAKCRDHLCVNQGEISREGETITCLPHKLTITVYKHNEEVIIS